MGRYQKLLLTTCTHTLNYGIRWYPTPKSPVQRFSVLELPVVHKNNAFLHLLIGHELFHPLLQKFFVGQTPIAVARLKNAITDAHHLQDGNRLDELVESVRYIWQRALEELMCDMGCASLFGPAAVFASVAFQMGSNFDESPSPEGAFYPPPRYRIREVLRYVFDESVAAQTEQSYAGPETTVVTPIQKLVLLLQKEDFSWAANILTEHHDAILREARKNDDLIPIGENPLLKVAYEEVQRVLPNAWDYVRQIALSAEAMWYSAIDETPLLLRNLELLVPPGEICSTTTPGQTKSPSLSSIATATWLYQLKRESANSDESLEQAMKSYYRCCRLMLKGFEDVELRREYNTRKGSLQSTE